MDYIDDRYLAYCQMFHGPEDPLNCWGVIRYCLREDREFPPRVKQYLIEAADSLLAIEQPGKETGKQVLAALEIKSGKDFSHQDNLRRNMEIYCAVKALVDEGVGVTAAARMVQESMQLTVDSRQVENIYRKIEKIPRGTLTIQGETVELDHCE